MKIPTGKSAKMPYIIAEIGFNHEGNMDVAKKMIEAAASAGADAVKFQTYRAIDLALPLSKYFKAIKCGEMSLKQHKQLADVAKTNKIDFLSTPYSRWAVDLLEKVGVKAYKIASMDLTNLDLLKYVASTKKPLIISTGMATMPEIFSTVKALRSFRSGPVTLLHCVSEYPTRPEDINLVCMDELREKCKCAIGYSDHTKGTFACLVAAILGASIIEKHFTLDVTKPGGDHYHSADPVQLRKLIEDIRAVLAIVGKAGSINRRKDRGNAKAYRRGVYACVNIPKGSKISKDMLVCCRPQSEFLPNDLGQIVGRRTRRNIAANTPITSRDLVKS